MNTIWPPDSQCILQMDISVSSSASLLDSKDPTQLNGLVHKVTNVNSMDLSLIIIVVWPQQDSFQEKLNVCQQNFTENWLRFEKLLKINLYHMSLIISNLCLERCLYNVTQIKKNGLWTLDWMSITYVATNVRP